MKLLQFGLGVPNSFSESLITFSSSILISSALSLFAVYCPLPPVGFDVNGAVGIGPVHGDISRGATLDYRRRPKAERLEDGYITRSARDACPF
jgi:hypothetical protein